MATDQTPAARVAGPVGRARSCGVALATEVLREVLAATGADVPIAARRVRPPE